MVELPSKKVLVRDVEVPANMAKGGRETSGTTSMPHQCLKKPWIDGGSLDRRLFS